MSTLDDKLIRAWVAHLDQELTAHRDLLAVADTKTRTLVERELTAMQEAVTRERELLATIEQLRIRRQRLRILSAQALGIPPDDLRMRRVIDAADAPERGRLLEQETQAREVVAHLQRVTERNAMLLRTSLGLVGDVLSVIAGSEPEQVSYNRGGRALVGGQQRGNICSFEA